MLNYKNKHRVNFLFIMSNKTEVLLSVNLFFC